MSICEYCGSKIFKEDRNCVKCGAPICLQEEQRTFGDEVGVQGGIENPLLYTYRHIPKISYMDNQGNCVIINQ